MAELNSRNFAAREAIYVRDRAEGARIISQGRTKLGQAEKRIYELKKELADKQLFMQRIKRSSWRMHSKHCKEKQTGCITIHRGKQHKKA